MVKDDILSFGQYTWRVLNVKDGRILMITEDIIELHWYHKAFEEITWADCEVRRYLNDNFYNHFSQRNIQKS